MGLSRLSDLCSSWASTLATSSTIQAWAQAAYSKNLTVFLGQNVKAMVTADVCPFCVIYEGEAVEGLETEPEMTVRVGVCVLNEDATTTGNLVSFDGLAEWHELADLIVAALSVPTAEHRVVSVSSAFNGSEFFPQWPGSLEFAVRPWG